MVLKTDHKIRAVMFDLDGTLVDTYRDLMNAANHVLTSMGFETLKAQEARMLATDGMIAMLRAVMKDRIDRFDKEELKKQFLDYYLPHICVESKPFEKTDLLLEHCRNHGIRWGIVTNKPSFLTRPLIESIPLFSDCSVIVCSDDLPEKKPDPRPLTFALEQIGITDPSCCIYAGDHIRDIQCGNNAGAVTVAAAWGYIPQNQQISDWGADFTAEDPGCIISILS